jgi:hypothetical protein
MRLILLLAYQQFHMIRILVMTERKHAGIPLPACANNDQYLQVFTKKYTGENINRLVID